MEACAWIYCDGGLLRINRTSGAPIASSRCCVEARFALCFIIFIFMAEGAHPLLRFPSQPTLPTAPRATHAVSFPAVAPLHHPHTTLSSSRVSSLILPSFRPSPLPGGLGSQSFVCIFGAPCRPIRGSAISIRGRDATTCVLRDSPGRSCRPSCQSASRLRGRLHQGETDLFHRRRFCILHCSPLLGAPSPSPLPLSSVSCSAPPQPRSTYDCWPLDGVRRVAQ